LDQKYLYLSINLLSVIFPFAFSFYPKANFSKKWKYLWAAILIPAALFILWDAAFTHIGVWGFNPTYLSGLHIGNLPIEEIMFFICIPYSCVFSYEASKYLVKIDYVVSLQKSISIALILLALVVAGLHLDKWYTCSTFLGLGFFVLLLYLNDAPFLGRFYFMYPFILIPFFLVNGILTGSFTDSPVVWYNDGENLGIRIGTIPIEDLFYGLFLLMMNVSIFEWLQTKHTTPT
jgi:lycopene cyclase domain-containing protein